MQGKIKFFFVCTRQKHTQRGYRVCFPPRGRARDALDGKGPQRQPQKRMDRRLEEVAKAVGGGYYGLQMPLKLALAVRTVAGRWLGALKGGGGGVSHRGYLPPFQSIPGEEGGGESKARVPPPEGTEPPAGGGTSPALWTCGGGPSMAPAPQGG